MCVRDVYKMSDNDIIRLGWAYGRVAGFCQRREKVEIFQLIIQLFDNNRVSFFVGLLLSQVTIFKSQV